jgi:DNA-binding transcriptional ArsR family regulator
MFVMKPENKIHDQEILDIKEKLELMHSDIKRMMENSNQEYLDLMMANLKKDFFNCITGYVSEDVESCLERGMVEKCSMRDTCKSKFTDLLQSNTTLMTHDTVPEGDITEVKDTLNKMREGAPFEKCEACFSEVYDIFDKQMKFMRSLHVYSTNDEKKKDISKISDEIMVKEVLEPLSNKQRIQILKSMASQTKTFSSLSEITGLKGGNLLFHIQKLLDTNMILQRHERGDYMITEKGYKLLMLLTEVNELLGDINPLTFTQ